MVFHEVVEMLIMIKDSSSENYREDIVTICDDGLKRIAEVLKAEVYKELGDGSL